MFGREQALVGISRIAGFENLVAHGEVCRETTCEVRTDFRSRAAGRIDEYRTIADEAQRRVCASEGVIRLRQPPDVVIALDAAVARADSDLIVESARVVIPHLLQPVEAELDLGCEITLGRARAHLVGEIAQTYSQYGHRIAVGLHELDVIASIKPAAGGIYRRARRRRAAGDVVAAVEGRRVIHARVLIVQVGGRRTQR